MARAWLHSSVGRHRPDVAAPGWLNAFFWYWVSVLSAFHVAFTSAGKTIVASTHTDLVACNDRGVMASTRRQPIRRRTVARTGSAALEDGPGASGSAAQIFAPRERQPGALVTLPPASSEEMRARAESAGREPKHDIAVVVLTQANRPAELARAIASVRAQQHVDLQLVLVVNGAHPPQTEPADQLIVLPENVGIPAGRNVGATAADARLVMFLDDDAELLNPGLLAAVVDRFKADPRLGAMAIRLIDEHGRTQRRHIPRVGARSAEKSGPVTYFIGAACVVRAETFHGVEGFDGRFFYAMEEVRPVLATARCRLVDLVLRRSEGVPPAYRPIATQGVRTPDRAEPAVDGVALAAGPGVCRLPADLDQRCRRPRRTAARDARRLPGGVVGSPGAATDPLAHRCQDDPAGPTAGGVTGSGRTRYGGVGPVGWLGWQ